MQKKVLSEGSEAYETWLHIPAPIYVKVYVFNLTNADAVAAGAEELVLQEIGPYVYQDHRDKIVYAADGETITNLPQSLFEFLPELTGENLHLTDLITTVNIPLVVSLTAMPHVFTQPPHFRQQRPWKMNSRTNLSS